jgi:hypothetical protein
MTVEAGYSLGDTGDLYTSALSSRNLKTPEESGYLNGIGS